MNEEQDKKKIRFLSFANDNEDKEKTEKLMQAAKRLEDALARERLVSELVDYKEPSDDQPKPSDDTRSLFDRLQEQKDRKREEVEESQKLSNMVCTLDDEDLSYLNEVAKAQREEELRKRLEVHDLMEQKRRLDDEKKLDGEKKAKELLLKDIKPKNKPYLLLKSKIKVKPKVKTCDKQSSSLDSKE